MTVRTVASWTCKTCGIDETDTGIACHKAAEKHIKATGHNDGDASAAGGGRAMSEVESMRHEVRQVAALILAAFWFVLGLIWYWEGDLRVWAAVVVTNIWAAAAVMAPRPRRESRR